MTDQVGRYNGSNIFIILILLGILFNSSQSDHKVEIQGEEIKILMEEIDLIKQKLKM